MPAASDDDLRASQVTLSALFEIYENKPETIIVKRVLHRASGAYHLILGVRDADPSGVFIVARLLTKESSTPDEYDFEESPDPTAPGASQ